jgi:hypothetical protein
MPRLAGDGSKVLPLFRVDYQDEVEKRQISDMSIEAFASMQRRFKHKLECLAPVSSRVE